MKLSMGSVALLGRSGTTLGGALASGGGSSAPEWVTTLDPMAVAAWDFANNRYWRGSSQTLADATDYTRAGTAYAEDSDGDFQTFTANQVRRTNKGVLIEPASTRMSRRPDDMVASYWWLVGGGGSSASEAGTALNIFDNHALMTAASAAWHGAQEQSSATYDTSTTYYWTVYVIAGTSGRLLVNPAVGGTGSAVRGVLGSLAVDFQHGGTITVDSEDEITSGLWRVRGTIAPNNASVKLAIGPDSSGTGNVVLVAGWIETGQWTSPILDTPDSTATRAADALVLKDPGRPYDLTFVFDDDSTQTITALDGDYEVPTDLDERVIKHVYATGTDYDLDELEDFGTFGDWTKDSFSSTGSAIAADDGGLKLSLSTPAGSDYVAADKTVNYDFSGGGLLVVKLKNADINAQGGNIGIYFTDDAFSTFLYQFRGYLGLVRGTEQFVVFNLDEFTSSGGATFADPMTTLRVRHDNAAGSSSVTFDKLYHIPAPGKDRPRIVITFDDGWDSQYDIAYPYMAARNIPGTAYIIANNVGTTNIMTLEEIQTLYAAGWDIGNHTYDHIAFTEGDVDGICASQTPGAGGSLTLNGALVDGGEAALDPPAHICFGCNANEVTRYITVTGELDGQAKSEVVVGSNSVSNATDGLFDLVTGVTIDDATTGAITVGISRSESDVQDAVEDGRDYLVNNDMPRAANHLAYPRGSTTPTSDTAVAAAGVLTARNTQKLDTPVIFGVPSATNIPAYLPADGDTAALQTFVDEVIANGTTGILCFHKIHATTPDSLTVTTAVFQAMIDYIETKRDAGLLDVLTISQWYEQATIRAKA